MNIEEKKKFLRSSIAFTVELHRLLLEHDLPLPVVPGEASNRSKTLLKIMGPDKKLSILKDDPKTRELLSCGIPAVENLIAARLGIRSWEKHIKRLETLEKQVVASNDMVRIPTKANAAHTHRCGGTEGNNFYNFPRRINPLVNQIKHCCKCPSDFRIIKYDYSQIEARRAADLAGQKDMVQAFADGKDIYSEFATEFYRQPVRKPKESDDPETYKKLESRREFGKANILGNQYGKGKDRTWEEFKKDEALEKMIKTGEIKFKDIDRAIKLYRSKYYHIPAFWTKLEQSFLYVFKNKTESTTLACGISIHYEDDLDQLVITLPSGACLYYQEPWFTARGGIAYKYTQSEKKALWGGFLLENIVQSDCGTLLREKVVAVEKELNLPVILDVYDSVYVLSPRKKTSYNFDRVRNLLLEVPGWMKDMPLAVEGDIADCLT